MTMFKYTLKYYLPSQSRLFSQPCVYVTNSFKSFANAIETAKMCGYEIISKEWERVTD